ncbi:MAG TPA: protein-glutamate O-methyltransferase CheR [Acidimicrobiales bacterium]|nr:protein-glutamate O-methyltransferase CheR [Acidimicrobiales bacterium]
MSPDRHVAAAARVLGRRVGMRLDPATQGRLTRCVQEAAAAREQDLHAYVASLEHDPSALQDLLDRITVQETSFFRDPGQFAALARLVPMLSAPTTVWSAGCSNGQEPYSIAMVLAESSAAEWRVIATDVSSRALERTRRARYSQKEMTGVSPDRRARWFHRDGDTWTVDQALRDRVAVSRHNLVGDPPPFDSGRCQVVFCRNVLIYFRQEDAVAFLERLAARMPPDGYLFLGYSESLWQVTDVFKLVRFGDAFVYRPAPSGGEEQPPPPARRAAPKEPRTRSRARTPARPTAAERVAAEREARESLPDVVGLLAEGEAAVAAGNHEEAVAAFRKAAYLEPDHPIPHLHLALALEAAGHEAAATRAYAAARAAVDRADAAAVEAALEGYRMEELVRLLDAKLGAGR